MNKNLLINNTIFTPSLHPPLPKRIAGLGLALLLLAGAGGAAAQPANDDFANAINLPGDNGSASGYDNIGATFQAGEPLCGLYSAYSAITDTIWFKWTATTSGQWTIGTTGSMDDTGNEWDAVLCLYTGASVGTLFPMKKVDNWYDETATIPVVAGTTYYVQLGGGALVWGSPGAVVTNLLLTWSFVEPPAPTVVDVSNDTTPYDAGNPALGVYFGGTVGMGNTGRLVGLTQTLWAGQGLYYINVDLNGNSLIVDTGGGNFPYYAYGDISGSGTVAFNTVFNPVTTIEVRGHNTYVGPTDVHGGYISLENPDGQDALLGPITVGSLGPAALVWTTAGNQINDAADVTLVQSGSFLDLGGFTDTIHSLTIGAGTYVGTTNGGVLTVTTLTNGGALQIAGTYTSANCTFVQGSASIVALTGAAPNPPDVPSSPVPSDTGTGVFPPHAVLQWTSQGATAYDVYLWEASGTEPGTPTATVGTAQYAIPTLLADYTLYNWQVVARNVIGHTDGPIWTFTTGTRDVDISNATTPVLPDQPDLGVNIDGTVNGGAGRLVGLTTTFWTSLGFTVDIELNGNELRVDTGGGNAGFHATGAVSGNGTFAFQTTIGAPILVDGTNANTYSGSTEVRFGAVILQKPDGTDALLGSITVGGVDVAALVWAANNQINDAADVTVVQSGSFLDLGGFSDTIHSLTLDAGTFVGTDSGGVLTVSSLTTNGVAADPGTYTAGNSLFVQGTAIVNVTGAVTPPDFPASGMSMPGGVPTFAIPNTVSTSTYTLFYKNNLTDATWTALTGSGSSLGNGSTLTLSDPTTSLPAQRFYRLGMQ